VVGEDTGEQEEERSLVGRVAEEESKQEGEEQEGCAVEKRTRWQIHSILNSEGACSQKVVNINEI